MIVRFSLYGFLKNQRYFEPFLLLALIQMGLSFFDIGLLIAFRELATNVMEIPSGAIADLYGQVVSIELLSRLRFEQKFDGIEPLVAQIRADVEATRAWFA